MNAITAAAATSTAPKYDGNNVIDGPFKVDVQQGTMNGAVSSQWFNRPDDQKFTDLDSLFAHVKSVADNSRAEVFESNKIQVQAQQDDADTLGLLLPNGELAQPTHWSFGQACSLVGAPAGYPRWIRRGAVRPDNQLIPFPYTFCPCQGIKRH